MERVVYASLLMGEKELSADGCVELKYVRYIEVAQSKS